MRILCSLHFFFPDRKHWSSIRRLLFRSPRAGSRRLLSRCDHRSGPRAATVVDWFSVATAVLSSHAAFVRSTLFSVRTRSLYLYVVTLLQIKIFRSILFLKNASGIRFGKKNSSYLDTKVTCLRVYVLYLCVTEI